MTKHTTHESMQWHSQAGAHWGHPPWQLEAVSHQFWCAYKLSVTKVL